MSEKKEIRVPVMVSVKGKGRGETRMNGVEFQKIFGVKPQEGVLYHIDLTKIEDTTPTDKSRSGVGAIRSL